MEIFPEFEEYPLDYLLDKVPSVIKEARDKRRRRTEVKLTLLKALLQYIRQYEAAKIIINNLQEDNDKLRKQLRGEINGNHKEEVSEVPSSVHSG
jgi:regulator of protease activity HflC (stomatin/prohibitin superfamily)